MSSYPMTLRVGFRIASSEPNLLLGSLFARRIPHPEPSEYEDHTEKRSQSDGGESRLGHAYVRWYFRSLDRRQGRELKRSIQNGINAGWLYLTVDRNNGDSSGPDWIDVRGKASMPQFRLRHGKVFEEVLLFVNAVEIVNDPAVF